LPPARHGLRHALLHALATELVEELLEREPRIRFALVVVTHTGRLRGLVDLDADRNHGRFHFLDHISKTSRRLNAVRKRGRCESRKARSIEA
jgi:3-deoxy-D-manno-octulosonic-acid transferase